MSRFGTNLQPVHLEQGTVLYETGKAIPYAYFPTDSLIAVVETLGDGAGAEVALVGNEGMLGNMVVLGGKLETGHCMVQDAGCAYRLPAAMLLEAFNNDQTLRERILLSVQMIYTQVVCTAICVGHHSVREQLCRWLLQVMDRTRSNQVGLTHEKIARMLGVRREGVTRAARELRRQGIIQYRRGNIEAVDRARLEAAACECYSKLAHETQRLLELQQS